MSSCGDETCLLVSQAPRHCFLPDMLLDRLWSPLPHHALLQFPPHGLTRERSCADGSPGEAVWPLLCPGTDPAPGTAAASLSEGLSGFQAWRCPFVSLACPARFSATVQAACGLSLLTRV